MTTAICVLILTSSILNAEETTTTRTKVAGLIHQLDADTLIERSRAERQLLEMGPEVLPFLPAPELIDSVSARETIRRIRPHLERRAAKESSAPSRVTLHGERLVKDVISQIQLQTKNRVSLVDGGRELADTTIVINWDDRPFWVCLDDLCERAALRWQFEKAEAAIRLSKSLETPPHHNMVQKSGPYRLTIDSTAIRPIVGEEAQRLLRVTGRLAIEPRLRPLFLSIAATDLKAISDEGHVLEAWNPEAKYEFPVSDGGREVSLQWDFRMPASTALKTIDLRGRFQCQIAAATERIVFDQTSQTRGTVRRRGGVTVRLRRVSFEASESTKLKGEIGITVSYDNGGPAFESHRSWIFHNAVYLATKDDVRTNFTDFDTTQQADGAVAIDYRWQNIEGPASQYLFVYEAPTLIIDVPMDVNLRGIPLSD